MELVLRFIFAILLLLTSAMLVSPSLGQAYSGHDMAMIDCDDCPDHSQVMTDVAEHGMTWATGQCCLFSALIPSVDSWSAEPIALAHPVQIGRTWRSVRPQSDLPPPRA